MTSDKSLCRWFVALTLLLVTACGPEPDQVIAPTAATAVAPAAPVEGATAALTAMPAAPATTAGGTTAPPTAESAAEARPGPGQFANPVIDQDFPDPDVLAVDETFYAYATNAGGVNVQLATSPDLVQWSLQDDALPTLPEWAAAGNTWAPEVTAVAQGYVLYFTARHTPSGRQCIGAATAPAPEGPFEPVGTEPLICQLDQGGSIDASSFVDDDGTRYLLWKNDGNCCGQPTFLYIQPVSDDGLALQETPTQLLTADQPWEGRLVEAPTLWKHAGRYYLFYSANSYAGLEYAVGYAAADSVLGPFQKGEQPLLTSDLEEGAAFGPGGQDVVADADGETWLLYHSWDPTVTYRRLQIDELVWENGSPDVLGPDLVPQPVP